jgi:anion-transporting  ArsA/GET3 family ATPase
MTTKDMTSEILARMTNIMNTLNAMSNELNKIKDWLTAQNDTLDKKTASFQLVNISGNLANMSSEIAHISDAAYTYSQTIGNTMVQQMISKVTNDLGNQSIILRNASNNLMIWSDRIEQNNRLNEIPVHLAELQSKLSEIAVYFTNLSNQLIFVMQTNM